MKKRMKNPLHKRYGRELVQEFGKYLVIFLFMTASIGFISGFLVTGNSMIVAYENSFEDYHIENGHFVLGAEASANLLDTMEQEGVTLYYDYYLEEETDSDNDGENDSTLRIFYNRAEHNQLCLMKGALPKRATEIAIDRMYADNNGLSVGDIIVCGGKELTISGLVALSDYSALFSDTTDLMFDAVKFGVAVMTKEGFASFGTANIRYGYAWFYEMEPKDEIEEKEVSDSLMEVLAGQAYADGNEIYLFLPRYANSAIQFTGEDMGSDKNMMLVLLYILIVILAFVFAVTIRHTIVRESAVIGTLRAMGSTKGELLRHYLTLPMSVTLAAAIVGNILGYTFFRNVVAAMYYNSYSLPTFQTIWNAEAFLLTTVVPLILMLVINLCLLWESLRRSPLDFLRHDISSKKQKRSIHLPDFSFIIRFRLRVILQNLPGYLTMFVGIFFANVLLLFGMMMSPLLARYQTEVIEHMIAEYQYVLNIPVETQNPDAEKYSAGTLKITMDGYAEEDASVYGMAKNSRYIDAELPADGVYVSDGFAQKFKLQEGDLIVLREAYGSKEYTFIVKGTIVYPATLSVFMTQEMFAETFDVEEGYYNGYFSDEELTDLMEENIRNCITEDDLTKTSRQLNVSMGRMFYLFHLFAIALFLLLIYLLTKLMLDKNAQSISMVKILGYENREIAGLYLLANTWVVIFSILVSLFLAAQVIKLLYFEMMKGYSGWLLFYIEPSVYLKMFMTGILAYLFVAGLQFYKIRKIPMDMALKNIE